MRTLAIYCIALTMMLQLGCTTFSRMTAGKSKKVDALTEQYMAGRQLESEGRLEGARELYKDLILKKPDNPEYLHRMAVVSTRLQRYGEATTLYERAKKLDPNNASLLTDMGYTAHLRGKQKDAERILREALKKKPNDLRATSNLALVIGGQGRIDESLELLRSVEDESTALAAIAYIHVQRGELDLAEQRYRESLNLNPQSVEVQSALAAVVQQRPTKEAAAVVRVSGKSAEEFADEAPLPKKRDRSQIQLAGATTLSSKSEVVTAGFMEDETDDDQPGKLAERVQVAAHVTTKRQTSSANDDDDWGEEASTEAVTSEAVSSEAATGEAEAPIDEATQDETATPAVAESSEDDWSDEPVAKPSKQRSTQVDRNAAADTEAVEVKSVVKQSKDDDWATDTVTDVQPRKRHRAKSVAAQLLEIDQEEGPAASKGSWGED